MLNRIGFFFFRFGLLCLAGVFSILLFMLAALQFDTTRQQILAAASSTLEQHTGWTVTIDSAQEITPFHWRFQGLTFQKLHESSIHIQSLETILLPSQLFLGRLASDHLVADGVEIDGLPPLKITASARVQLLRHRLIQTPSIQGRLTILTSHIPLLLKPWLGKQVAATAAFRWQSDRLHLDAIEVTAPQLTLNGGLSLHPETKQIESSFTANVHIANALPAIALNGQLAVQLNDRWSASFVQCTSDLQCQVAGMTATSSVQVQWKENEPITLRDIQLHLPSTSIRGNLEILTHTDGKRPDIRGELIGSVNDLSTWSGHLQVPVAGTAQLVARFNEEFSFEAEIDGLRLGDDTKAEHLSFRLNLNDLWDQRTSQATMTGYGLASGELSLRDFSFEAHLTDTKKEPEWGYTLGATGHWHAPLNLTASGNASQSQKQVSVKRLTGILHGETIALESLFEVTSLPEGIQISPFRLRTGRGTVEGHGSIDPKQFTVTLQLKDLPLGMLSPLIMRSPAQGALSGTAVLSGTGDNPELHIQLAGDHLSIANSALTMIPQLKTSFIVDIKDQQLSLQATLTGLGERPLEVTAQLPIQLTLSNIQSAGLQPDLPISAQITTGGEISPILEALFPGVTHFTGHTDLALTVNGTLDHPVIGGTLSLQQGTFESLNTGCVFKNIQARLEAHDDRFIIHEFQATDGEAGTLTGAGMLKFDATLDVIYELTFDLNNVVLLRRDFIKGTGSGRVQFKGQGGNPILSGDITTTAIDINIPQDSPSSNVTPLDVTFVNAPKQTQPAKRTNDQPIKFDVAIHVPDNATVTGNDLRSQWRGEIRLLGDSEAPELHGELKLTQGEFRINGKPFVLGKGQILFDGDIEKNTTVSVSAIQEIAGGNIEAILRGPVRTPSLSLRANPPMSQREILSWILFGRGLAEASPFETSQLNQLSLNVPTAGKKTSKPTMLSRLQRFGIDRINVDSSDDGVQNNVSVNVGKYLTKGLYVSVNKGITTDGGRVSVEADVIRNVKLKAEVTDDAASKMLLMWRRDY